ncbi:IS30 family transposase [Lacticaseibacillus chiayiensis]|uniref:IS30 family transposase n=3 Tax=Lacticaseibacillus chiayiensis TaxID=2100821 RepID=A0ABY6H9U3_9LACO|nr:IS30 family transposase [Lacticaseibacillus chiayiensis]QVI35586.1 IS30 family transposase [Lacticaseibacillus chiayiensis]RXT53922.1 hypothetical protein CHT97_13375 [Lacticaseibacillus chiayiensis]UYN55706.1 IS30 family transposase [Lacticaseibacillus chiayiensis]UYN57232.1 IS30 family transposase [Lacticaseibacillus chiayiensis]
MTQDKFNSTRHYTQLTAEDRGVIEGLHHTKGFSIRKIAARLHRAPSTISRELNRGKTRQLRSNYLSYEAYYADTAQILHEQRCQHDYCQLHLKGRWHFFFNWLTAKVKKAKFRLQSIDGYCHLFKRLYPAHACPSTPTVYRYLDRGLLPLDNTILPEKLRRHIKHAGRHRDRRNKRLAGTSIEQRPQAVNERKTFGDWEGDLVKGKRVVNEPALLTLTERKSRYELIYKLPDYHAQTCLDVLQRVINSKGAKWFHSITFDNGSEFALLDRVKGTQIYYCHPYTPSERGSNENANGLIRELIPKGISLHHFSKTYIHEAQKVLNGRLRKSLGYRSAADVFQQFSQPRRTVQTPVATF